jgi:hypothetical protein
MLSSADFLRSDRTDSLLEASQGSRIPARAGIPLPIVSFRLTWSSPISYYRSNRVALHTWDSAWLQALLHVRVGGQVGVMTRSESEVAVFRWDGVCLGKKEDGRK